MVPIPLPTFTPGFIARCHDQCRDALELLAVPREADDGSLLWTPRPDAPELIVVLLRSGKLPFRLFQHYARGAGVPLPPVSLAHIGREVWSRYVDGNPGTADIIWTRQFGDENRTELRWVIVDFYRWLQQDPYMRQVLRGIQHAPRRDRPVRRVLVLDEPEHEGSTRFTTELLLHQAFPDAEPHFRYIFFPPVTDRHSSWDEQPDDLPGVRQFLHDDFLRQLLKGYLEQSEGGLVPITEPAHLREVGLDTTNQLRATQMGTHYAHVRNATPYPRMALAYGDEALLAYREQFIAHLLEALFATGSPPPDAA